MRTPRRFALLVLLALTGAAAAWVALTELSSWKVRSSAEAIAGDDPYCIQISGDRDYREVRTLADLSILRMRVDSRSSSGHHAVLAIERVDGTELLHWSYWNQAFMGGAMGPPAIYCTPRSHYLATVGRRLRPESPASVIRVEGMTFSVPRSFRPYARYNSHGILFNASAPLFENPEVPSVHGLPVSPEQLSAVVEISFGKTGRPTEWLHKNDSSPGDCMHTFYHNGWTYTFHHPREFLGDWKAMQERLSALAASFLTSRPIVSIEEGLYESHMVSKLPRPNSVLQGDAR
jgi:hypothetical protein